jgi:hypothetical protein
MALIDQGRDRAVKKPPGTVRLLLTGDVMLGASGGGGGSLGRTRLQRPNCAAIANLFPHATSLLHNVTGRGIDQVLPFHCDPVLYEACLRDARGYVKVGPLFTSSCDSCCAFPSLPLHGSLCDAASVSKATAGR